MMVMPKQKVLFEKRKKYQPRINAENADFVLIFLIYRRNLRLSAAENCFSNFFLGITNEVKIRL
jgi:hypothetical protein